MEILKHKNLHFYLLLQFAVLIAGCIFGCVINPPGTFPDFDFETTLASTLTTIKILESVLIKNIIATFIIISCGIIGYKFIPSIFIFINGFILGKTISVLNYNPQLVFSVIFPHGYIEFPILLFTGACACIISNEIHKTNLNMITLLSKHKNPNVKYIIKNYLLYPYVYIIIPCLIVAGIIEATFSLWNLKILLGFI